MSKKNKPDFDLRRLADDCYSPLRITVQVSKPNKFGYHVYWVIRSGAEIRAGGRYMRREGQVSAAIRCLRKAAERRGGEFRMWE